VGEEKVGRTIGIEWWSIGDGFTWDSTDMDRTEAIARAAWAAAVEKIGAGDHEMIVLDEITYPINWGWIALDDVLAVLSERPDKVNVILTGRDAPAGLVDHADTATEMVKIKHAFDTGVRAKRGIDL
jgi:cob(I)alamin adenosyltransferase